MKTKPEDPRGTVLVVDDSSDNLTLLNSFLKDSYRIKVAKTGEKALEIALAEPPDLVLLDIMMPGMDGYQVIERLAGDPRTSDVPVIFLTSKTTQADEIKGFAMGAVDYVTKPVSPERLKVRIRTHVELSEARRRLAEQNAQLIEAARLREDVDMMMRHDLKSPLNVLVAGPSMMLDDDNLDEAQREQLHFMERASLRMLHMINRSLDLLKMEQGRYEPVAEDVDLVALAVRALADLERHPLAPRVSLKLTIDGAPAEGAESVLVRGEALLCLTLLENLGKNAVEASPEGGVVVLDVRRGDPVRLVVENDGEVPEAIRDTFFDKYVTAGKTSGTGLGTYSARLVAETQGGSIALDSSTPGHTRVEVTLPAG